MAGNAELVRRGYEAYAKKDTMAVLSFIDPDIEVVQTTELPWGGRYEGLLGVQEFFGKIGAHIDALPQPEQLIEAGNDVAVTGRLKGRTRGTGREIDIPIVHVWTLRNGRAVRLAAYIDTPAMKRLLEV